jgi:hypothetical protein
MPVYGLGAAQLTFGMFTPLLMEEVGREAIVTGVVGSPQALRPNER